MDTSAGGTSTGPRRSPRLRDLNIEAMNTEPIVMYSLTETSNEETEENEHKSSRKRSDNDLQEISESSLKNRKKRVKIRAKKLPRQNSPEILGSDDELGEFEEEDREFEEQLEDKIKKTKFCRKRYIPPSDEIRKRRKRLNKNINNFNYEECNEKEARIRNSPRLFSEVVFFLSDEQKDWVKSAGFEYLLDFDLEMVPSKLAAKVFQVFDHTTVALHIKDGRVPITEEDVFDIFGLPFGGTRIEAIDNEETGRRMEEWLAQFPNDKITTSRVVEKIRAETRVTEMFKANFLTVLTNVLIGTPTNSYVDRQVLKLENFDNCAEYNWAEFLIRYLVKAKKSWHKTASHFFRGSMIFLTLYYVDRVKHEGEELVERKFPSFKGWTEERLKERQALDLLDEEFGMGKIQPTLREYFSQQSQSQKTPSPTKNYNDKVENGMECANDYDEGMECANDWNHWPHGNYFDHGGRSIQRKDDHGKWNAWPTDVQGKNMQQKDIDHKNEKQHFNDKECVFDGNVEDTQFPENGGNERQEEDCVEQLRLRASNIINEKWLLEKDLKRAIETYPLNQELLLIEDVLYEVFTGKNFNDAEKDKNCTTERQEDIVSPKANNGHSEFVDAGLLEHLDFIDYMHSEKGIKDMNDMFHKERPDSDYVPSFSLFSEMDYEKEEKENAEFLTPKPVIKSPYIQRVIDLNAAYSNEDIILWRYMMLQEGNDGMQEFFAWKGVSCIKQHMRTMKCSTKLFYSIVDSWSTILNDVENYKTDESPMRLFCTIGDLKWSLDENKNLSSSYEIFYTNMNEMLNKYPQKKLQDIDMVFFPIHSQEHFYLICYNLKNPAYEIIDNIQRGDNSKEHYGKLPSILHAHFAKYLQWKGLQMLSHTIRKLKPSYLSMPWQSKSNSVDSGIFLMRHMETYKGDMRTWVTDTGLKNEGDGHFRQIIKLRTKYNTAILSSQINEKRDEILNEAKKLFEDSANQTILKIQSTKKKTVTFAANLSKKFDEA